MTQGGKNAIETPRISCERQDSLEQPKKRGGKKNGQLHPGNGPTKFRGGRIGEEKKRRRGRNDLALMSKEIRTTGVAVPKKKKKHGNLSQKIKLGKKSQENKKMTEEKNGINQRKG